MNSWGREFPCCKLWFPLIETSGSSIYDYSTTGVVLPCNNISFAPFPNTIALDAYAGAGLGVSPTTGTLPDVGNKDFILFNVHRFRTAYPLGRPECDIYMGNFGANGYGIIDGDAFQVNSASSAIAGTDNAIGMAPDDANAGANAVVRNGQKISAWIHNDYADSPNDWAAKGDVFCDTALNGHVWYGGAYVTDTTQFYSDYVDPATLGITTNYPTYAGLGRTSGGFPGIWSKLPSTSYSMPYTGTITIGRQVPSFDLSVAHYGIALFVFNTGLPSDWKAALRWMRDQWLVGNKVLWPAWTGLT